VSEPNELNSITGWVCAQCGSEELYTGVTCLALEDLRRENKKLERDLRQALSQRKRSIQTRKMEEVRSRRLLEALKNAITSSRWPNSLTEAQALIEELEVRQ
jgi:hypothetical protein